MKEMERGLIQIIQKCRNLKELKQTHLHIIVHGLHNSNHLLPKLIDGSSSLGSLNYAIQIFEHSQDPNVVVHNTMIKCLVDKSRQKDAFLAYTRMRLSGVSPNNFTFTFLLKACQSAEGSSEIQAQIVKFGFGDDVFVQNALLNVCSKCSKDLDLARRLFDEMPERDVVSWNSMVGAYMANGDMEGAMHLFEIMPERNVVSWNTVITSLCKAGRMVDARAVFDRMTSKNTISWNAMITGYVNCNAILAAQSLFDRMEDRDVFSWTAMISGYTRIGDMVSARNLFVRMPVKNVVSWNVVISGYNQNGQHSEALSMFQSMMLDGKFRPDEATLVSVVSACAQLGSLEHGNWVYSYLNRNNFELTVLLGNTFIDMFAKCGDIKKADMVFRKMTRRSIVTWTAIVSGLAFNGQCREALALFKRMCSEQVEPDDVIFIAVLSACSHGGLVEEGHEIFDNMVHHYQIKPRMEHYSCMVDLLGRAGKLKEAIRFMESMPMEPSIVIWATLLSFCTYHGTTELIEIVSQKVASLMPSDPCYQVLLSNSNAHNGKWDYMMDVRATMRREGIEKVPGCSSIQIGREVHEFIVKDSRHRRRKEIYEVLYGLTDMMKQVGYDQLLHL